METAELIRHTLRIARDRKGENLRVLDVGANLSITDYFVLITVGSRRQAQGICAAIDTEMKRAGVPKARIEGFADGWWVLLDFDVIVVHVFQKEAREFYDLDQLWADSRDATAEHLAALPEAPPAPSDMD